MKRHPRHGNRLRPVEPAFAARGQRHPHHAGGQLGIVPEHFIKIPHAEKQDVIGVLRLELLILAHGRGQLGRRGGRGGDLCQIVITHLGCGNSNPKSPMVKIAIPLAAGSGFDKRGLGELPMKIEYMRGVADFAPILALTAR